MCYSYPVKNASCRAARPTILLTFCLVWARKAVPQITAILKCDACDVRVGNYDELKTHRTQYHSHNKASQCERRIYFEQVNCCDETINSEENLKENFINCQTELVPEVNYNDSHTCEICQARCNDMRDLERHLAAYHCIESKLEVLDGDCFQCDPCPLRRGLI